jgi:hypothetical protein
MILAAFIISVVALVGTMTALLTVAQMVWGKPDLVITFDSQEVEGGRVMTCKFCNYPVAGVLLYID